MTILEEWRRTRANTKREDFISLHPYAFLISATGAGGATANKPMQAVKPTEFRTVTHKEYLQKAEAPSLELPLILPLKKGEGRPFPERISVGRATNCDVVIRDASISKLHGHFRDVTAETAFFTDAKSSNGTRLNGTLVAPGVATEIRQNMLLSFGRVQLMFMSPSDVYDWL
ncbi:MAG TPA: FHA domain-containing protein [Polyangiales bacterium]|nr:FHA domain-containing protein [Polyangiales bacterium]